MRDRCQKFSIFKTWQLKNNLLLGTNNTGKLKEFIFYIKHFNLFSEYEVLNLNEFIDFIFSKFENLSYIDATFFCSICVLGKNQRYMVSGSIPGFIIKDKRGNNGFGYDPYFIPTNNNKTFAEMDKKQKLLNSHRYEAFKKLSNQILQGN